MKQLEKIGTQQHATGASALIEVGDLPNSEGHRLFHKDVHPAVQRSLGVCVVVRGRGYDVQHVECRGIQQVIDRSADVWNPVRRREAAGSLLVDIGYGGELCVMQSFDKACMVLRDLAAADNTNAQPCLPCVVGVHSMLSNPSTSQECRI